MQSVFSKLSYTIRATTPPKTAPRPSFAPLFAAPAVATGAPELEAAEALLDEAEAPADDPDDAGLEVVETTLALPLPVVLAAVDPPLDVVALALPELTAVADDESVIVVRTPPTGAPGADAAATGAAAFAKSEADLPAGGLTTPTMPFWQCFLREQ